MCLWLTYFWQGFHDGERIVFSINNTKQLDSHMQKNEVEPYITPYTKNNSKSINNPNIRSKTIKLLE